MEQGDLLFHTVNKVTDYSHHVIQHLLSVWRHHDSSRSLSSKAMSHETISDSNRCHTGQCATLWNYSCHWQGVARNTYTGFSKNKHLNFDKPAQNATEGVYQFINLSITLASLLFTIKTDALACTLSNFKSNFNFDNIFCNCHQMERKNNNF